MNRKRLRTLVIAAGAVFALAACSSSGSGAKNTGAPTGGTNSMATSGQQPSSGAPGSALPTCAAKKIGPITRCENFYTDYWPIMQAKMKDLYEQARQTNGGVINIWAWYAVSDQEIQAFTKQYPGLTIKTQGLQANISSAVVAAKATGGTTSDRLGGSWTQNSQLLNQGYNEPINWADYGVPKEWLPEGAPWFPYSVVGWTIQYNKTKVSAPPTNLEDYLDPKWHKQIAIAPENLTFFEGYGFNHGEQAMVDLISKLKSSGNLILTSDPTKLLTSGDVSVVFGAQNYSTNPDVAITGFQDSEIWPVFDGVNKYGKNKPGGALFQLWWRFDPTFLKGVLSHNPFAAVPYPGLPESMLDNLMPTAKANLDVWIDELDKGWAVLDTEQNADKIKALQVAVRKAAGQ